MKSKITILIVVLLLSFSSNSQVVSRIKLSTIKNDLTEFLIQKGDIRAERAKDYRNGKFKIFVLGLYNNDNREDLLNGIYVFSAPSSHTRSHYLIIEDEKYTILDLTDRQNLEFSIKILLDFCERQRYCSDITAEYTQKMISLYYRKNKNPVNGMDVNCESGIKEIKDLP